MKIPEKTWKTYLERLSRIDRTATSKMIAYMNKVPETLQNNPEALVEYAYGISTKYGEAAAALACEMYDAIADISGVPVSPAIPAEVAEYGEVAKAVYGTRKTGNQEIVANSIGRLVKRTGADTTIKNAIRDGAEWAWIPNGDTCAFCLTLASRGWQEASSKTLKGDHAEHIHANCDCSFQIRFDRNTEYAGYDPDKYLEMYENAEGKTSEEKINALRRARYAKNKNKINAQKREAYNKRKEKLQSVKLNDTISDMWKNIDITEEYAKKSEPNTGNIEFDENYVRKKHDEEIAFAQWIHNNLGGDIKLIKEVENTQGVVNPDYLWNGKLWDLKTIGSQNQDTIDQHIRKGLNQIAENPGGIFIDISKNEMKINEMKEIALKKAIRRSRFGSDIIIVKGNQYKAYRIQK